MKQKAIPAERSFAEWRRDLSYVKAYNALDEEFALASALIDARMSAGLSQDDVAKRMKTSQPAVARLEGGRGNPSLGTLRNYAAATGTQLHISFERPKKAQARRS